MSGAYMRDGAARAGGGDEHGLTPVEMAQRLSVIYRYCLSVRYRNQGLRRRYAMSGTDIARYWTARPGTDIACGAQQRAVEYPYEQVSSYARAAQRPVLTRCVLRICYALSGTDKERPTHVPSHVRR
eukprot:1066700-Rhodomonas_salina.2